jgi:DNA-binding transcriptional ArsR family regulator
MDMADDHLSNVFVALADPTRRAILARLIDGDLNVAGLSEPFAISQPAVSKHLKILERAGLISRSRAATARLSHLEAAPLKEATEWMDRYRTFWDESFTKLDAALAAHIDRETEQHEFDTPQGDTTDTEQQADITERGDDA